MAFILNSLLGSIGGLVDFWNIIIQVCYLFFSFLLHKRYLEKTATSSYVRTLYYVHFTLSDELITNNIIKNIYLYHYSAIFCKTSLQPRLKLRNNEFPRRWVMIIDFNSKCDYLILCQDFRTNHLLHFGTIQSTKMLEVIWIISRNMYELWYL